MRMNNDCVQDHHNMKKMRQAEAKLRESHAASSKDLKGLLAGTKLIRRITTDIMFFMN